MFNIKFLEIMKLESLKDFQANSLNQVEMNNVNGGVAINTATGSGSASGTDALGHCITFNYGYDVNRGGTITYHDRSNVQYC